MGGCDQERCYCCGKGHWCEPPVYPSGPGETWTCPECGTEHDSFHVNSDPLTPQRIKDRVPADTYGWRTTNDRPAEGDQ